MLQLQLEKAEGQVLTHAVEKDSIQKGEYSWLLCWH
jgi:hypothetical protein